MPTFQGFHPPLYAIKIVPFGNMWTEGLVTNASHLPGRPSRNGRGNNVQGPFALEEVQSVMIPAASGSDNDGGCCSGCKTGTASAAGTLWLRFNFFPPRRSLPLASAAAAAAETVAEEQLFGTTGGGPAVPFPMLMSKNVSVLASYAIVGLW